MKGIFEFVDSYPTIAGVCGLTPPAKQDGVSFRALLDDPTLPGKVATFKRAAASAPTAGVTPNGTKAAPAARSTTTTPTRSNSTTPPASRSTRPR